MRQFIRNDLVASKERLQKCTEPEQITKLVIALLHNFESSEENSTEKKSNNSDNDNDQLADNMEQE